MNEKKNLVPKLRFPEFQSAGAWTTEQLGAVATISTQKVGNNVCVPMSITSGVGLVSQEEKFGRVIAGDSYKNYLLLKPNEFAYNKSATKEYPEGFLALYSGAALAAVPNSIFTCFRINGESPDVRFLNYQFSDNLHGRWLRKFIQVGARAHGSLSINDSDLMALPVPVPSGTTSIAEQQKIADCLSSLDELIAAQARKVDALKTHKKGLMQQLFPREGETQPRLRFPEFRDGGGWVVKTLDAIAPLQRGFDLPSDDIRPGSVPILYSNGPKGFHERGMANGPGLVTGRSGTLGKLHFIESGDYWPHNTSLWVTSFKGHSPKFVYYLYEFIGFLRFASGSGVPTLNRNDAHSFQASVPNEFVEQERIAACLGSLDTLITAAAQEFETLKTHNKGLMQQLFPSAEAVAA